MNFARISTRDIIACLVVGAAVVFNGIALVSGKDPDAATMTLAGAVVGYYFNKEKSDDDSEEEPLPEPFNVDEPA